MLRLSGHCFFQQWWSEFGLELRSKKRIYKGIIGPFLTQDCETGPGTLHVNMSNLHTRVAVGLTKTGNAHSFALSWQECNLPFIIDVIKVMLHAWLLHLLRSCLFVISKHPYLQCYDGKKVLDEAPEGVWTYDTALSNSCGNILGLGYWPQQPICLCTIWLFNHWSIFHLKPIEFSSPRHLDIMLPKMLLWSQGQSLSFHL